MACSDEGSRSCSLLIPMIPLSGKLVPCPSGYPSGFNLWNGPLRLIPLRGGEEEFDDGPDSAAGSPEEARSYLLQSPVTPVALKLFDQTVIPEEDSQSSRLSNHPPLTLFERLIQVRKPADNAIAATPIDEEPAPEVSSAPGNVVTGATKPKLIIPTSTSSWTNTRPSPYPWQQDTRKAIMGGNVSIKTDVGSPASAISPEPFSALSPESELSINLHQAMLETPNGPDSMTPLSPQSPMTLWKQPSISLAIASLRRVESTTRSIDNLVAEERVEGRQPVGSVGPKALTLSLETSMAAEDHGNQGAKAELEEITADLRSFILGTAPAHAAGSGSAENDADDVPDRPQSPKSRNASQTRLGATREDSIDPVRAERQLSWSRNSLPSDIGREMESRRPRSNPILEPWSHADKDDGDGSGTVSPGRDVRRRSLSALDHLEQVRVRPRSLSKGYTGGNPYQRPRSIVRGHRALIQRGVRLGHDGPQIRRVSRGDSRAEAGPGTSGRSRPFRWAVTAPEQLGVRQLPERPPQPHRLRLRTRAWSCSSKPRGIDRSPASGSAWAIPCRRWVASTQCNIRWFEAHRREEAAGTPGG